MKLNAYNIILEKYIEEINSKAIHLEHKKTKAKVIVLSNDDNNKTFCIGFKTPPKDDTGVPHILEHSVLCGSTKFPSKEPFVELMKGSLNTFLNAMTYPDKTLYPIASCNEKDFQNLMDVYLDAVFNPNIYKNEMIFKQEGWHYELTDESDELVYNGVVFNEMKGAYSSGSTALYKKVYEKMLSGTCYEYESGGDPKSITDLTYEQFLNFHSKYYHPSNSYIFLSGDMNYEEKLDFIDKEYLSKYDYKEIDSSIGSITNKEEHIKDKVYYQIGSAESEKNKTYLTKSYLIENFDNMKLNMSFSILSHILFSIQTGILREALIKEGICSKVSGSLESYINYPLYVIEVSDGNEKDEERFNQIVDETLLKLSKGIDKKLLESALNAFEFKVKEAEPGSYPKGLLYILNIFTTYLYGGDPFITLEYNKVLEELREEIKTDYFEKIIEKYLLNCKKTALISSVPSKTIGKEIEKLEKDKLDNYKKSLTKQQTNDIIIKTKELKEYQAAPSNKEDIDKIPTLTIDDLDKTLVECKNDEYSVNNIKLIHHDYFTNGITYLSLLFELGDVDEESLKYYSLLISLLGKLDTKNQTFKDLSINLNMYTGGVGYSLFINQFNNKIYFIVKTSFLNDNIKYALDIISDIINNTLFDNVNKVKEIISMINSSNINSYVSRGNAFSSRRALSYIDEYSYLGDVIDGIEFIKFIKHLYDNYDQIYSSLINKLQEVFEYTFTKDKLLISVTSSADIMDNIKSNLEAFIDTLKETTNIKYNKFEFKPNVLNEGFKTSSNVQYVSRCGNYVKHGYTYNGFIDVLHVILNTEYLWVKGRVLGGAYGCYSRFSLNGNVCFSSYRDPNLKNTNEIYENILTYIKDLDITDDELVKFIIGASSNYVFPMSNRARGEYDLTLYLENSSEMRKKGYTDILNCKVEDIKGLYDLVKSVLDDNALCVIGNEDKIENEKELFKETLYLIK